jgi:hypothetical protein
MHKMVAASDKLDISKFSLSSVSTARVDVEACMW